MTSVIPAQASPVSHAQASPVSHAQAHPVIPAQAHPVIPAKAGIQGFSIPGALDPRLRGDDDSTDDDSRDDGFNATTVMPR